MRKTNSKILLGLLAALALSAAPAHADSGLGWLIFQAPRTDGHGTKIRGQARPIYSTWLRRESRVNTTIYLTYPDSQTVPVSFVFPSDAEAFLAAIQGGKSVDLTRCAHSKFVRSTPVDEMGCYENTYKTEFHCDLLSLTDHPKLFESSAFSAEDFETNGTSEPEITTHEPGCLPVVMD